MPKPRNPPPHFHRSVQTMLVLAVLPVPMSSVRLDHARERLLGRLRKANPSGEAWTRPNSAGWRASSGAGHTELFLCQRLEQALWLMKLEPGGSVGQDVMERIVESIVISGSCYMNGRLLSAGDVYVAAEPTQRHELISPDGCLLYVCGNALPSRFVI